MKEKEEGEEGTIKCIYCGKELEDKQEKGSHIAEEHAETDSNIPRKKRSERKKNNIIKDKWDADGDD